ncbi:MAG: sugar phosphate isomerase/epimerase [Candidatus Lokiarchaeota archaeon]|nr:sugar phosphate isomerase/epimerase [Candidatus Lokiarchaeota archaeon]
MKWRLAICQEIFGTLPFEACCEQAAAFGYGGIELAPYAISNDIRGLPPEAVDDLRATAARHGLELPAMHWLLASPPGMSITSPDPAVRERTSSFARALVEVAARAGVRVLVFGSPKQRDIDPSWPRDEAYQRGVDFLSEMARGCERRGIVIGFEPLGPSVTNFGATVAEAMAIIDKVASPALQLHLDLKALHSEPLPLVETIAGARGRIVHFHANDVNMLGPGMGEVDYRPVLRALAGAGYAGWISVETFRTDVAAGEIAARSIAYLKEVMDGI